VSRMYGGRRLGGQASGTLRVANFRVSTWSCMERQPRLLLGRVKRVAEGIHQVVAFFDRPVQESGVAVAAFRASARIL
jgi:hypothetical protein